jgi:predicted lactoylglutathione lyase
MTRTAFGSGVSLVTLGVADLRRSREFYGRLGFDEDNGSNEDIAFLKSDGVVLALFPRHLLADDALVADDGQGFDGVTLARNFGSEAEVDAAMAHAIAAGGRQTKAPQKVFWGGYSGYFADPDGHLWEIAHNPFVGVDDTGRVTL